MHRIIMAILAVAAVVAGAWAFSPRNASLSDLAMIGGHDTGGQGLGGSCTGTIIRNCNHPNAAGQCDKEVPYCVSETPSQKTCKLVDDVLHPCQDIPPSFPACAHRHHVTCSL